MRLHLPERARGLCGLVCFRDVVFVFMFRYVSIFDTRSPLLKTRAGGRLEPLPSASLSF